MAGMQSPENLMYLSQQNTASCKLKHKGLKIGHRSCTSRCIIVDIFFSSFFESSRSSDDGMLYLVKSSKCTPIHFKFGHASSSTSAKVCMSN